MYLSRQISSDVYVPPLATSSWLSNQKLQNQHQHQLTTNSHIQPTNHPSQRPTHWRPTTGEIFPIFTCVPGLADWLVALKKILKTLCMWESMGLRYGVRYSMVSILSYLYTRILKITPDLHIFKIYYIHTQPSSSSIHLSNQPTKRASLHLSVGPSLLPSIHMVIWRTKYS